MNWLEGTRVMRASVLVTFIFALAWELGAAGKSSSFPYDTCLTTLTSSRYEVSSQVINPGPNLYCFTLRTRTTSGSGNSSACYKNGDVSKFVLLASPGCDGAIITATLNNIPIQNGVISRPATAASTRRILTVAGLTLNVSTIGSRGAQLCLKLPSNGTCNTFSRLAVGDSAAWLAALFSADGKCCPVSGGRPAPPPPKGSCQSCFVWDVVGRDGTAATTPYNFLNNKGCELPLVPGSPYNNCCQHAYNYMSTMFDDYRARGYILSGFDRGYCDRTSYRMCGIIQSEAVGRAMIKEWVPQGLYGWNQAPYDITDDMCPMALINSTIRFYGAKPGSNSADMTCTPFSTTIVDQCWQPSRQAVFKYLEPGEKPFPKETCNATPGNTPFTVEPYEDIRPGNTTTLYCINIGAATPLQPQSACGKSTAIDRVSFWMLDDDFRKPNTLGVYMLTLNAAGTYVSKRLNAVWGPDGDNTLNVASLGLDLATVKSARPKICLERGTESWQNVGIDTVDGMNYLWTALYDTSGACCPTYYSNSY